MQRSTTPFLLISFLFLFVSCATNPVNKGLVAKTLQKATFENPYFSSSATDYVYKANITVYGNELSGIFIAKKLNETTHRIVFTTEFGNKLMDFEISETDFKINSIVPELNRKMLINTLQADFRMLFRKQYPIQKQFEDAQQDVYKSEIGNKNYYLFTPKGAETLLKIVETTKRKEKINISFTSENDIFANKIVIQHYNIKLKIEFNYFKP